MIGSLTGPVAQMESRSHQKGGALIHKWDFNWEFVKPPCKFKCEPDLDPLYKDWSSALNQLKPWLD